RLPKHPIPEKARPFVVLISHAGVKQVRRERIRWIEVVTLVYISGEARDSLVLHREIAETIEDRCILVHLDTTEDVRTVTDEGVRAAIDAVAGKRLQPGGDRVVVANRAVPFVGVEA